ncbi:MAG TPA: hypothetical protein VGO47_06380 [Chlamydiales bacterium]|jgi:hypothetical protein|nr:hypothetical protein [Chlamydiales bacterium]
MISEDPGERPTSSDALNGLRMLRSEVPSNVLDALLKDVPLQCEFTEDELPDVP